VFSGKAEATEGAREGEIDKRFGLTELSSRIAKARMAGA